MDDLRRIGIEAASVTEVVKRYSPLSDEIVAVLLKWLDKANDFLVETVVRALGLARPLMGNHWLNAMSQRRTIICDG